jgi:hypothetical protein
MIAAISYDKLRLSENLPTNIIQKDGSKGIQAKLDELSERITETERVGNAKLVTTD